MNRRAEKLFVRNEKRDASNVGIRCWALNVLPFLFMVSSGFGELHWDAPRQSFRVQSTANDVKAIFKFQNAGSTPITINDVKTSCGCTTAALAKKEYAPGETGEIVANFHVAGRTGHQEKAIFVEESDQSKPIVLSLLVDIQEMLSIEPEFVMWQVGGKAEAKTIHIRVSDDVPVKVTSIKSDNPAMQLIVHETKPGKEINLELTPSDTAHPVSAVLLVHTDYPPENPQTHYAYARVK
jgi:Protein of unknown function (DUF1573)